MGCVLPNPWPVRAPLLLVALLWGLWVTPSPGQTTAAADEDPSFEARAQQICADYTSGEYAKATGLLRQLCSDAPLEDPHWQAFVYRLGYAVRRKGVPEGFLQITDGFLRRIDASGMDEGRAKTLKRAVRKTRSRILLKADRHLQAAEELVLLIRENPDLPSQGLARDALGHFLYADRPELAQRLLDSLPQEVQNQGAVSMFRWVIPLYQHGPNAVEALSLQTDSAATIHDACTLLLRTGRHEEVAWVGSTISEPDARLRIVLSQAYYGQHLLEQAEEQLRLCLRDPDAADADITKAARLLAAIYAARLSLSDEIERLRQQLAEAGLNATEWRRRTLSLLAILEAQDQQHAAALRHRLEQRDCLDARAGRRIPLSGNPAEFPETLWSSAHQHLLSEERDKELIVLANQLGMIFPSKAVTLDLAIIGPVGAHGSPSDADRLVARLATAVEQQESVARHLTLHFSRTLGEAFLRQRLLAMVPQEIAEGIPDFKRQRLVVAATAQAAQGNDMQVARLLEAIEPSSRDLQVAERAGISPASAWLRQIFLVTGESERLLVNLMGSSSADIREAARERLRSMSGEQVLPLLRARLSETKPDHAEELLSVLRHLETQVAMEEPAAADPAAAMRLWDQVLPFCSDAVIISGPLGSEWIDLPDAFPVRVNSWTGNVTRFEDAIRALVGRVPACYDLASLGGVLFAATDAGLLLYRPQQNTWGRLRLPNQPRALSIYALDVRNDHLEVRWRSNPGNEQEARNGVAWFAPEDWTWRDRPQPDG